MDMKSQKTLFRIIMNSYISPNKVVQWSQLRSANFMVSLRSFYHKNCSTTLTTALVKLSESSKYLKIR